MRRLLNWSAFFALALAASASPALAGGDKCEPVNGPFTSEIVPPPPCESVVGLCTHGILLEDLEATYDFVADSMAPSTDPAHPGRLVYTGHSVITFNNPGKGQLFGEDTGFLDPDAFGNAHFETTVNIVSGTRSSKRYTGMLVAEGDLSFATGHAVGTYSGEVCKDKD
jgi:hypothetical protein